ncbi:glycosyltransferase [Vibrio nomapromontoriensis]|uniref:glycosyltransferase n=1 Tax=Vibrio nomapromontoriensis TaxID=2910246 RepID=UPI003D0C01F4
MKRIVISAVNLVDGGTFSILNDLVHSISFSKECHYYILVHSKKLFEGHALASNISLLEYPDIKSSWLKRIYFEYFQVKKLAVELKADFWLSLHDISPKLPKGVQSAVYCHNPTPFAEKRLIDILYDPKYFLFTIFYRALYKINISSNKYVFVQQQWIADEFSKFVPREKIIVTKPGVVLERNKKVNSLDTSTFFFPSYARPFKNFEVLLEAVSILEKKRVSNFRVYVTIDGTENLYTKRLIDKYHRLSSVTFLGRVSREKVASIFEEAGTLVFPSKLETWGLPISEAKEFSLSLLVADLPYAKETVGNYDKVSFFSPNDPSKLASLMLDTIKGEIKYEGNAYVMEKFYTVGGWESFIDLVKK